MYNIFQIKLYNSNTYSRDPHDFIERTRRRKIAFILHYYLLYYILCKDIHLSYTRHDKVSAVEIFHAIG